MIEIKRTENHQKRERCLKDGIVKALIAAPLFRLANGLLGDISSLGGGVSELRIHYGPGYRIYFHRNRAGVILLSAGTKRSQNRDIEHAKELAKKWKN